MTKAEVGAGVIAVVGMFIIANRAVTTPAAPAPVSCATLTIDGTPACNTAVVLTRATDVQSVDHFCRPTGGVSIFACSTPNPSAWCSGNTGYTAGTWVDLWADASSTGPAWLNVNNCGQVNVKQADGVTDPGSLIKSGSMYHVVSDGVVWRMLF